jgi:hypothetical protein
MSQAGTFNQGGGPTPPGTVLFLEGDLGGDVGPDGSGVIHVIAGNATNNAGSSVLILGNPGINTLRLDVTDVNGSTLIGLNAGNGTATGLGNTALGSIALSSLTTGANNVGIGRGAGTNMTSGSNNTLVGNGAGAGITTGTENVAVGRTALNQLTTGTFNVAIGNFALAASITGTQNTAVGDLALSNSTTSESTVALGDAALFAVTTGSFNTGLGVNAGTNGTLGLTTGHHNVFAGWFAGSNYRGAESENILLGANVGGTLGESGTIRIGVPLIQTRNFQAGIFGVTPPGTLNNVIIDNNGQLGSTLAPSFVAYGQVYNQSALLLPNGANVTFDSNGPLLNIAHVLGSDTITVNDTGLFMIQWTLQTDGFISSISLNVNGVSVPNLSYVTNPSIEAEYNGEGIVLLNSGDLVTLTIFSAGSSDLITFAGFTNASITLEKLNISTGTADSAALFNTDSGVATVAAGTINIVGGAGISTFGAGNTVTITGGGITQINGDTGSATGSPITFTGLATAGSTVSFDASGSSVVFNVTESLGSNTYIGSGTGLNSTFAVSGATINTAVGFNCGQNMSGGGNVFMGISAGGATLGAGSNNVGIGNGSMQGANSAGSNVAVGTNSLFSCTGAQNVALGFQALLNGGAINNNIAIGFNSGLALTTDNNIAIGGQALQNASTGSSNTAIGTLAMANSSGSSNNIAIGTNALTSLVTGNQNIAIGQGAGTSYSTGIETNNIVIGADPGIAGESSVTRIGVTTSILCYMGGIFGSTVGVSGIPVVVDSADQLGTVVSSARFKYDIKDLPATDVLKLRPVSFKYKKTSEDAIGLIAEEVEKVMPSLVAYDKSNDAIAVKYNDLPVLLLAEIQNLKKRIELLESR